MAAKIDFTLLNESYNKISFILEDLSKENNKVRNNLSTINNNISITGQYTLSSNYKILKDNLTRGLFHAQGCLRNLNEFLLRQKNEYEKNVINTTEKLKKYLAEVNSFLSGNTTNTGGANSGGVVGSSGVQNGSTLNLTYYYTGDDFYTQEMTGSGIPTKDFNVNENGWYTYPVQNADGTTSEYVVLAGPTTYLKDSFGSIDGKTYFTYGDVVNFTSNGVTYQGIIADSCGNAMRGNAALFDIFVKDSSAVNPTSLGGVEKYELVGHAPWGGYQNIGFGTIQPK